MRIPRIILASAVIGYFIATTGCVSEEPPTALARKITTAVFEKVLPAQFTLPIHTPICPKEDEDVTFRLAARSIGGIHRVTLRVEAAPISSSGVLGVWQPVDDMEWPVDGQEFVLVEHTSPKKYPSGLVVHYQFDVYAAEGDTQPLSHEIYFATEQFPLSDYAVPVYAQAHPSDACDVVFIPDVGLTEWLQFRDACDEMMQDAILTERSLLWVDKVFNFYMNPHPTRAKYTQQDVEDGKVWKPANNSLISFAEAHAILHDLSGLRDRAWSKKFTARIKRPEAMRHEFGHAVFRLSDEYQPGGHEQLENMPNNWKGKDAAKDAAPNRHKTVDDVRWIEDVWWRICADRCQMNDTDGRLEAYDWPCVDRIVWVLLKAFQ